MPSVFPKLAHDHTHCVDEALSSAERICRQRGARFTDIRREVLSFIWSNHEPVGAYEILAMMNNDVDTQVAPMTVYRGLDFLMKHGLVHRISNRNAFVGCAHPDASHSGQFLICRECGRVAEIEEDAINEALRHSAKRAGFDVASPMIEIEGRCIDCRDTRHD